MDREDENVDPKHSFNNHQQQSQQQSQYQQSQQAQYQQSQQASTKKEKSLQNNVEGGGKSGKQGESGFLHYLFGVQNAEYQHHQSSNTHVSSSSTAVSRSHGEGQQHGSENGSRRLSSPVRAMAPKRSDGRKNRDRIFPDDDDEDGLMSMSLSRLDLESPPMTIEDSGSMSEKEELETQLISK